MQGHSELLRRNRNCIEPRSVQWMGRGKWQGSDLILRIPLSGEMTFELRSERLYRSSPITRKLELHMQKLWGNADHSILQIERRRKCPEQRVPGRLVRAEARSQAEATSGGTLEGMSMNFSGKAYLTRASSPEHLSIHPLFKLSSWMN